MTEHLSHVPAREIFAQWDAYQPTEKNNPAALAAITQARLLAAARKRTAVNPAARQWAVTPQGARRIILRAAGLDAELWHRPIDSFNAADRAEIRAAALEAVRVFGSIAHGI